MVAQLAKPGADIVATMTPERAHLLHMAMGISGEVAELLLAVESEDTENAIEELGDIEFYLVGLCQGMGIHFDRSKCVIEIKKDPLTWLIIVAGDVLDQTKKVVIYDDNSRLTQLGSAIGEFVATLDTLYKQSQFAREQAIEANIKKLGKRYKGFNYSDQAAKVRADKEGE